MPDSFGSSGGREPVERFLQAGALCLQITYAVAVKRTVSFS